MGVSTGAAMHAATLTTTPTTTGDGTGDRGTEEARSVEVAAGQEHRTTVACHAADKANRSTTREDGRVTTGRPQISVSARVQTMRRSTTDRRPNNAGLHDSLELVPIDLIAVTSIDLHLLDTEFLGRPDRRPLRGLLGDVEDDGPHCQLPDRCARSLLGDLLQNLPQQFALDEGDRHPNCGLDNRNQTE
ncbi:hypothetical protein QSJ18_13370 [Gordonia sp. ABSL1-1]|uniref:hypothetical protein n=1 Tax=Gordonia sp. ABSL1-1 TaxID=3053923 RepID=UPI0025746665|nr:hypothetical protein [Gordonia sp. ABSL1-1]MDL9937737.1 hypothetical protein [Gordonia sp. ABSL1-1]